MDKLRLRYVLSTDTFEHLDDDTPIHPDSAFGTLKHIGELLLAQATRQGWVDARALRFTAVVVRPR